MDTTKVEQIEQFLKDEKELLTDLAHSVAKAESDFDLATAKASYSVQLSRISGIEDILKMLKG